MANNTTNYNLVKPSENEYYDINVSNSNLDIIDTEIKKINDRLDSVSTDAQSTSFDNSSNGMEATNVQDAIEENKESIEANKTSILNLSNKTDKINADIKSFKNENLLLNGDFLICQEGTTSKTLNRGNRDYIADMWIFDFSNDASSESNFVNILPDPIRLASNSVKGTSFNQYIEKEKLRKFLGKKFTLSFKVMCQYETGVKIRFFDADVTCHTSQTNKIPPYQPNTYHTVSLTFTLNSLNDRNPYVSLTIDEPYNNDGWFDVVSAKLELGEVATEHIPMTYEIELLKCRRYYEKKWSRSMNSARSSNWLHFLREYVPKYTQPTVTVLDPKIRDYSTGYPMDGFYYREPYFYQDAIEINFEKINHGQQAASLECYYILDSRMW